MNPNISPNNWKGTNEAKSHRENQLGLLKAENVLYVGIDIAVCICDMLTNHKIKVPNYRC